MISRSRSGSILAVAMIVMCVLYILGQQVAAPSAHSACPKSDTITLIAAYGDSTTEGWKQGNMPAYLEPLLCNVRVVNEGVSGTRLDQLLNGTDGRHKPWAEEMRGSTAHVILINFGINERIQGISQADYLLSMRELVRIAKKHGKQVVLETPNPIFLTKIITVPDEELQRFAQLVSSIATHEGVGLVDVNRAILELLKTHSHDALYADPLHPTPLGYELIAKAVAETLRDVQ